MQLPEYLNIKNSQVEKADNEKWTPNSPLVACNREKARNAWGTR